MGIALNPAKLLRKFQRALLDRDPSFCDMYEDERASRAGKEYLAHIRRHLQDTFGDRKPLAILDAGCQAGRLLIPLAQDGHRVVGIDTSAFALRRAGRHAKQLGLSIELHTGSIAKVRSWIKPASLNAAICAEVLYLCRDYRQLLRLLADSLKPGGLLIASHRPLEFYVAKALQQGKAALAEELRARREGPSPDGTYHNWQTADELEALYREAGVSLRRCEPIDRMAGVPSYLLAIGVKV